MIAHTQHRTAEHLPMTSEVAPLITTRTTMVIGSKIGILTLRRIPERLALGVTKSIGAPATHITTGTPLLRLAKERI